MIDDVRNAVAAASSASDLTLRTIYIAGARALLEKARAELDAAEALVHAHEQELRRVTGEELERRRREGEPTK